MHRATKHNETTKTDTIISASNFDRIGHLKQHDEVLAIILTYQIVGKHGGGIWSFKHVRKYALMPRNCVTTLLKKQHWHTIPERQQTHMN